MTRWAKDTKEFTVRLYKSKNRDATPSLLCRVPRPLVKLLGDPSSLKFCVKDGKVIVEGVNS
ncbi:MAG: hypothetical protein F4Y82_02670 [Cenarchaeum sp. SB0665_bin_23]|nr:hypothetical protein [Cenarchaeum sp. SB0667_bin_13]MXY61004.1 hypothetical protein [Cenarchaeum sp. SB0665_bin_23]MXZ93392.1 hypothetical protein [Cenarchaeum sp. SB0666_bin_15]MYB46179.1 hypothetical protein [Cenarchaeum sp. SB0662_bin_33]MYC80353.1 hypothetical protein [Cenarchaeum sp. SB0661_bin_35]MYD58645.1 hypothetical protein [Cenarchaeum sp. SB0678_bin_8]MYG32947.1 hypothetical protein [Cenarchaeum sp. SB0677_bin_16]